MTGNNPLLCIGGPKDGCYFTVPSSYAQLTVRELAPMAWEREQMEAIPVDYRAHTHTYYRQSLFKEQFLVHEMLYNSSDFPRNLMAALKNGYKVIQ